MVRGMRDAGRPIGSLFDQIDDGPRPDSVTGLTRTIKRLLEDSVGRVWVEGEISNLSMPRSGHIYLTLKDERAAIGAVMWKSAAGRMNTPLEDGMRVVVRGSVAVYEPQGRYQIVCDSIKAVGQGDLQARFEELKARLAAEGLFSPALKVPVPNYPTCVGIVTSATGAAVQDMIRILRRRQPALRIILAPAKVQGSGAAEEIVLAITSLIQCGLCDTLLVGRGGGSLEDLWCFNEEAVARAIYACPIPVISAVGHETDVTIADLVADLRAATPSEAAEIAVPDREEQLDLLRSQRQRLSRGLLNMIERAMLRLKAVGERPVLRDPMTMVGLKAQRLDELADALHYSMDGVIEEAKHRLAMAAAQLEALSPLAVLSRGYSATWDREKQRLVRKATEVTIGTELETRLGCGRIRSLVTGIEPAEE